MKISFNANKFSGAYGGGNQFANALENHLVEQGHQVYRTLEPDLDLILIISSKYSSVTTAYSIDAIKQYKRMYPNTVVIHRVNACDEQRGTVMGYNTAVLAANESADFTVFVSQFMQDLFFKHGLPSEKPHQVILSAADEDIFNAQGNAEWLPGEKMKIVTHHWSNQYLKGFDIYERLDILLGSKPYCDEFEFTFIGNVSISVDFKHVQVIEPLSGQELAQELKQHHLYVTGTRHEPGGNHYIEAVQCGLPVLYLESGSTGEYCEGNGMAFDLVNFEEKLLEMRNRYSEFKGLMGNRPHKASIMAANYTALFTRLIEEKQNQLSAPLSAVAKLAIHTQYFLTRMVNRVKHSTKALIKG